MKYKITLILCLLFLVGCKAKEESKIDNFFIGVIETTQSEEKSSITYYDSNLKELGVRNLKFADLSSYWNDLGYFDHTIVLIPTGLMKKKDTEKILTLNLNNLEVTEYPINRVNIGCANQNEEYVYAASNLNGEAYITGRNKQTGEVKEVKLDKVRAYVSNLTAYKDNLYAFYFNQNDDGDVVSGLHIYDKNLVLTKTINLNEFGWSFLKTLVHEDKMYIPNARDIHDQESNKLLVLDLITNEIQSIDLPYTEPNDIVAYNNSVIISHSSIVEPNGSLISMYDIQTGNITSFDLKCNIARIDIVDNILVVLNADNKLITFDVAKGFSEINEIELTFNSSKNGVFKSNIFVNK